MSEAKRNDKKPSWIPKLDTQGYLLSQPEDCIGIICEFIHSQLVGLEGLIHTEQTAGGEVFFLAVVFSGCGRG